MTAGAVEAETSVAMTHTVTVATTATTNEAENDAMMTAAAMIAATIEAENDDTKTETTVVTTSVVDTIVATSVAIARKAMAAETDTVDVRIVIDMALVALPPVLREAMIVNDTTALPNATQHARGIPQPAALAMASLQEVRATTKCALALWLISGLDATMH